MILTNCAACAAPLAHDAPRCVRCKTRYCNKTCQHDHWRRGHKQMCKKIHRAGNAEQYHADKKYKEAVAEAVEACADDTKGQTCYICTQALHWKTKEGLVRMCACRGTSGFVHVSCLAEQAKILMAEAEANNLGSEVKASIILRYQTCSLCEQNHHGVVLHALGWACWKTYVGRPETDGARSLAMKMLGNGLFAVKRHDEQITVVQAEMDNKRRLGLPETALLDTKAEMAILYSSVGRHEEALELHREVYAKSKSLGYPDAFKYANNLATSFLECKLYEEGKSFLRARIPEATRELGPGHMTVLFLRINYASILGSEGRSRDDLVEAVAIFEELSSTARRVLGTPHPTTMTINGNLERARSKLASFAAAP